MKKFAIFISLLFSFSAHAELYSPDTIKDIKHMAQEIFDKKNPKKVFFIIPLENFIIKPTQAALQIQEDSYKSLLKTAFSKVKPAQFNYINELILTTYHHKISDLAIIDLIEYIQQNEAPLIIVTPNFANGIEQIDHLDQWTVEYLKKQNIDLEKGVFADKKILLKEFKKVQGSYPSFYKGLLSCNNKENENLPIHVLNLLLVVKLKQIPDIMFVVSSDKNYLETLEKQLKILKSDSQFFGILYNMNKIKSDSISPENYLKFWQDFVTKLRNVKRKKLDEKSENPYDEE